MLKTCMAQFIKKKPNRRSGMQALEFMEVIIL